MQSDEIELEQLENHERYKIGDTKIFNRIDTQKYRLGYDNEYTKTDLEYDIVHDTEEVKNKINKNLATVVE